MEIIFWIFSALLIIFSILDIKSKAIPSIFLTATILFLGFMRFVNFEYAVLMGLLGLLMWEFSEGNKTPFGMADIKIMIMLGFFISTNKAIITLFVIFAVSQFVYIYLASKVFKKEIPFVPLFLWIWILGNFIGLWT
jgi:hypothetical protein